MVCDELSVYVFVVGQALWAESRVQLYECDVGGLREAWDQRHVDFDAFAVSWAWE